MRPDPLASAPNIVLVTTDSLRADHVYGDAVETPAHDALSSRGQTYYQAFAQGPFTTFSMPSLFTSRYPSSLRYLEFSDKTIGVYIEDEPTIPGVLRERGYETAGFHSNPLLSNLFGFDSGFDAFDARLPLSGLNVLPGRAKILTDKLLRMVRKHPYLPAEKLTTKGLNWLDERNGDAPFFLWLHYMDVHGPYQSKSGWSYRNKYRGERLWRKAVTRPAAVTDEERERLKEWYREEIEYTDRCLGRLVNGLDDRGLLDETLVVATADHGEQFGEHGRYSHPHQVYEELIRVPLIVAGPGRADEDVDDIVELVDVGPTLSRAAGADVPESFVGDGLEPGRRDEAVAISEAELVPTYTGSVRTDRWKYIREGDDEMLFDLDSDPDELEDVSGRETELCEDLATRLDDHLSVSGRDIGPDRSVANVDIDEGKTEDRLRDLGYLE